MFCQEYLVDGNASRSAISAGYSKKTAYSQGSRLLKNVKIVDRLLELSKKRAQQLKLDQDYVLRNLTEISERCLEGKMKMRYDKVEKMMVPIENEDGEPYWEFDSSGANRANELIGRHLAMFTDVKRFEGPTELDKLISAISDEPE